MQPQIGRSNAAVLDKNTRNPRDQKQKKIVWHDRCTQADKTADWQIAWSNPSVLATHSLRQANGSHNKNAVCSGAR
jgi:hypothetical protein